MNIDRIDTLCMSVPLPVPHTTASGTVSASPLLLLTLTTDDGVQGHGLLFTYTPVVLPEVARLVHALQDALRGRPLDPPALTEALRARFRLLGTQGLLGMAIAGLDMAAWDALARARGLPLVRLLGGTPQPLRAYAPVGFDGPAACAAQAEAWAARGFPGVKAKLGYPTLSEDVAVLRAMRAAVGPDVAILVDYNQSLTPAEAARRLPVLDELGLEWIEEPVGAHDLPQVAALSAGLRTPLQIGENWWCADDFASAFALGVRRRVMADAMKCGGVTGWRAVAALCARAQVPLSSHLWPDLSAHLMCASPAALGPGCWLEWHDWWRPVWQDPLALRNGCAMPSEGPGAGPAPDLAACARFAL